MTLGFLFVARMRFFGNAAANVTEYGLRLPHRLSSLRVLYLPQASLLISLTERH